MLLSPHFPLALLVRSDTAEERGIDNTPPPELLDNLKRLASGLERVQALLGAPLAISSGYRCPELNAAVGGASASQHTQGLAADFVCPGFGPPVEIARTIGASAVGFDQCILEWDEWVHVSFAADPRGRLLTIYDARAGYLTGLWARDGRRLA